MAGSRTASRRREVEEQARRERLLRYAMFAVLAIVAVIIAAGVYLTQYRPPRAHIATIEGHDITAADVVDRATYFMLQEGGAQTRTVSGIADFTLDVMESEITLRERGPAEVGAVTDDDVDAELRQRFGFEPDDPAFANTLADVISGSGLSRDGYFDLVRAQILQDRLQAQYLDGEPQSAPQRHLMRARVPSEGVAEQIRQRVADGEGFQAVAEELVSDPSSVTDLDWIPLRLIGDAVSVVVEPLGEGEVSASLPAGLFFDVYYVAELDEERELTDVQREGLAQRDAVEWIQEQRGTLTVTRDLSASEDRWITNHVSSAVAEALRGS